MQAAARPAALVVAAAAAEPLPRLQAPPLVVAASEPLARLPVPPLQLVLPRQMLQAARLLGQLLQRRLPEVRLQLPPGPLPRLLPQLET